MVRVAIVKFESLTQNYDSANESLGVAYLNSALRSSGMDSRLFSDSMFPGGGLEDSLIGFRPNVLGYSVTHSNIEETLAFDRKLRFATRPFKCYGGSQVTFTAEEFLTHEDADAVVLGEAEITLPELVRVVNSKGDISTIAGICYKDGWNC